MDVSLYACPHVVVGVGQSLVFDVGVNAETSQLTAAAGTLTQHFCIPQVVYWCHLSYPETHCLTGPNFLLFLLELSEFGVHHCSVYKIRGLFIEPIQGRVRTLEYLLALLELVLQELKYQLTLEQVILFVDFFFNVLYHILQLRL